MASSAGNRFRSPSPPRCRRAIESHRQHEPRLSDAGFSRINATGEGGYDTSRFGTIQNAQRLQLVGAAGFEPATARPPAGCATRLRHAPKGPSISGTLRPPRRSNRCEHDRRPPRAACAPHLGIRSQRAFAIRREAGRAAARGDTAAFEELVSPLPGQALHAGPAHHSSEADARDCVQEGFISAWRGIDRFRIDARFSTWMYRIVVRKAYDVLERRKRLPVPTDELPVQAAATDPGGHVDLMKALDRLDPDFRTVAGGLRHRRALDGRDGRPTADPSRHRQVAPVPCPRSIGTDPRPGARAVSDEQYDELGRRLRDTGITPAPPDLRGEVMAQVAAEPRRRRSATSRWWRPALAVAAVACGVIGLVVGLSNLGGASSSSGSSGSASSAAAVNGAGAGAFLPARAPTTFSLNPADAKRALNLGAIHANAESTGSLRDKVIPGPGHTYDLYVPANQYADVSRKLRALQRRASPTDLAGEAGAHRAAREAQLARGAHPLEHVGDGHRRLLSVGPRLQVDRALRGGALAHRQAYRRCRSARRRQIVPPGPCRGRRRAPRVPPRRVRRRSARRSGPAAHPRRRSPPCARQTARSPRAR